MPESEIGLDLGITEGRLHRTSSRLFLNMTLPSRPFTDARKMGWVLILIGEGA